jgi:hypothetical protein
MKEGIQRKLRAQLYAPVLKVDHSPISPAQLAGIERPDLAEVKEPKHSTSYEDFSAHNSVFSCTLWIRQGQRAYGIMRRQLHLHAVVYYSVSSIGRSFVYDLLETS